MIIAHQDIQGRHLPQGGVAKIPDHARHKSACRLSPCHECATVYHPTKRGAALGIGLEV